MFKIDSVALYTNDGVLKKQVEHFFKTKHFAVSKEIKFASQAINGGFVKSVPANYYIIDIASRSDWQEIDWTGLLLNLKFTSLQAQLVAVVDRFPPCENLDKLRQQCRVIARQQLSLELFTLVNYKGIGFGQAE